MKSDLLRNLGPGTQLMFVILIAFVCLFMMQITAFLIIRPIWQVNIFDDVDVLMKLETAESIHITKILQVFNQLGMFLIPALVFKKLFGSPERNFFVLRQKQSSSVWPMAAVFFILAFPFINLIHIANLQIPVPEEMAAGDADSALKLMKLIGGGGDVLILNFFVYALIPALAEEFLFRGVVLRQIALSTRNMHVAVWVSAALFSFIHSEITVFIPRLLMGAMLGYMFVWTGNIWVGVVAHFFNNLFTIILLNGIINGTIDKKFEMLGAFQEDLPYLIPSIILTIILAYLLYKKRNDSYRMFISDYERELYKKNNEDDVLE